MRERTCTRTELRRILTIDGQLEVRNAGRKKRWIYIFANRGSSIYVAASWSEIDEGKGEIKRYICQGLWAYHESVPNVQLQRCNRSLCLSVIVDPLNRAFISVYRWSGNERPFLFSHLY